MLLAKLHPALARPHQLDKAQLNRTGADPVEEGLQAAAVEVAHQHAVDLDLLKAGVDACHHLMELVLAGNGVEPAGVKTAYADVERGEAGVAPGGDVTSR
ncbi:Cyclic pyranopterin monophosphate synthase|nr:Cyclic pyranopterin monophosphate synthase [Candidatus Pantoea persica]